MAMTRNWLVVCSICVGLMLPAALAAAAETGFDLQLAGGYRQDDLNWNIAGTPQGTNPNVLSELTWEDLEIYQVRGKGILTISPASVSWYATSVQAQLGYGWIVDGESRDSDYLGDNRTLEFSRSVHQSDGDDVLDLSIAAGPQFRLRGGNLVLTPLIGFSYHEQNLRMTDGVQVISVAPASTVPLGPFPGLDSTFETQWGGPWLGFDVQVRPLDRLTLNGFAAYHFADYEAEANWNLRSDLEHPRSFEQDADGEGVVLSVSAAVDLGKRWRMELRYDFQDWQTDDGTSRMFFSDGEVADTRLNEVNWESQAIMLGVNYRF